MAAISWGKIRKGDFKLIAVLVSPWLWWWFNHAADHDDIAGDGGNDERVEGNDCEAGDGDFAGDGDDGDAGDAGDAGDDGDDGDDDDGDHVQQKDIVELTLILDRRECGS